KMPTRVSKKISAHLAVLISNLPCVIDEARGRMVARSLAGWSAGDRSSSSTQTNDVIHALSTRGRLISPGIPKSSGVLALRLAGMIYDAMRAKAPPKHPVSRRNLIGSNAGHERGPESIPTCEYTQRSVNRQRIIQVAVRSTDRRGDHAGRE